MYTGILSGFLYGWCLNSVQRQLRQRQLPILRLVCFVMFKPHSLNRLIMAFLFLSISGLDKYIYIYINCRKIAEEDVIQNFQNVLFFYND